MQPAVNVKSDEGFEELKSCNPHTFTPYCTWPVTVVKLCVWEGRIDRFKGDFTH